jgi:hypothetical protein
MQAHHVADTELEMRGDANEGFPFAWFEVSLVKATRAGDPYATVRLTRFTEDDGRDTVELATAARLRPPSKGCSRANLQLPLGSVYPPGSHVDVLWRGVWWEAVVKETKGLSTIVVAYTGACHRLKPHLEGPLRCLPLPAPPSAARAPRRPGFRASARIA